MNEENQTHDKLQASIHKSVEHVRTTLVPDYGQKIVIALIIIAIAIIAFLSIKSNEAKQVKADREILGQAIYLINNQQNDSAQAILQSIYTSVEVAPKVKAKAALLLGNILFNAADYTGALEKFTTSASEASDQVLIKSAAEHGIATVYLQQKEYAKAEAALAVYLTNYARKTSALQKADAPKIEADLVVDIPDALWKLALCQKEQNKVTEAKATCQKIINLYGDNMGFSAKAKSLLVTL